MRTGRVSRVIGTFVTVALASTVIVASPAGAEQGEHVVVVGPGRVQAALNAASPGSTVKLLPGTYHERIDVAAANVTLEGSGSGAVGGTLLEWPAAAATGRCAPLAVVVCLAGNGDRVTNRRVDVRGGPANPNPLTPNFGIYGFFTAGATVDRVAVVGNGAVGPVGILLAGTNGTIRDTQTSGLSTALGASEIDATIEDNTASGNCNGIVVVDLGLAGVGPLGQASHVTVKGNRLLGPQICPPLQGEGIQLIGAAHSTVEDNFVAGLNDAAVFTNSRFDTVVGNTRSTTAEASSSTTTGSSDRPAGAATLSCGTTWCEARWRRHASSPRSASWSRAPTTPPWSTTASSSP